MNPVRDKTSEMSGQPVAGVSNGMKLLIITQAVDERDPVLGFFTHWLTEFAKHLERVEVICLRKGQYELPPNVRVHSLGKERGVSRARYVLNFYTYIWRMRHDYDAVFVHMNPEYVVLGGFLWRLWRKRIALWYTHKSVNLKLRVTELFAHIIFTASKESFRLPSRKVRVMGHGIDTDFFSPDSRVARGEWYLSVGRLMPSKDHKMAIVEARNDGKTLRIAGEGPERENLEAYAHSLGARVEFLGGLSQAALRDEYRKAMLLIHTSKTGSLDKVVLEALACGLPVRTYDPALADLPVTVVPARPEALGKGVIASHDADGSVLARYVREHHSLARLIPKIVEELA